MIIYLITLLKTFKNALRLHQCQDCLKYFRQKCTRIFVLGSRNWHEQKWSLGTLYPEFAKNRHIIELLSAYQPAKITIFCIAFKAVKVNALGREGQPRRIAIGGVKMIVVYDWTPPLAHLDLPRSLDGERAKWCRDQWRPRPRTASRKGLELGKFPF